MLGRGLDEQLRSEPQQLAHQVRELARLDVHLRGDLRGGRGRQVRAHLDAVGAAAERTISSVGRLS